MLAVGSDDPNTSAGGKVQIHEYNDSSRSVLFKSKIMSILVHVYIIANTVIRELKHRRF